MPVHRRLLRDTICQWLIQIREDWNKLNYPRFVIQAEKELNPERCNEASKNFSFPESVRGYVEGSNQRKWGTHRLHVDTKGRPDKYILIYANRSLQKWNDDIRHHTIQIYKIDVIQTEIIKGNRRKDDYEVEVFHTYLQTLRGKDGVGQVDKHIHDGIDGLGAVSNRIQNCLNVRRVDSTIKQVLAENERIQNGR